MIKRLICLLVCLAVIDGQIAYAAFWGGRSAKSRDCAIFLAPEPRAPQLNSQEALDTVFKEAPELVKHMGLANDPPAWYRLLEDYILPFRRSQSRQLALALIGPSDSGKSTILNMLAARFQSQGDISTAGFAVGSTSRPVFVVNSANAPHLLAQRFGQLVPWAEPSMSSERGLPLVYSIPNFYKRLILIDAPSSGVDAFRPITDQVIRWADVLIYLFTFASNRSDLSLRQLRETFERIGNKPVIMVYRTLASMPKRDAFIHMQAVANAMFPNAAIDTSTQLPAPVLGTYILLESDKVGSRDAAPLVFPFVKSAPFLAELQNLDDHAAQYRQESLQNNFKFIVDGIDHDVRDLQQKQDEIKLTDEAFQLLMQASINVALQSFSFARMSIDLRDIWHGRHQGIHNAARWVAHPMQWARGHKTSLAISEVDSDIKNFLNSSVDTIISSLLLAASTGKMDLPVDQKGVAKLVATINAYHERYGIPNSAAGGPYFTEKDHVIEFHLSNHPTIEKMRENYLNRDWDQIKKDLKAATLDSTLRLTYLAQAELDSVAGRTKWWSRTRKYLYSLGAVGPFVFLAFYIFFSGVADIKAIFGLVGASVNARILVYFDNVKVDKEWPDMVAKWFHERQFPFFKDQLNRYAKFEVGPEPTPILQEFGRLQTAARILSQNPPQDLLKIVGKK